MVLAQIIVEHLEPVTVYLDYLLVAVAVDIQQEAVKELRLALEAQEEVEPVEQLTEPQEQQLRERLELQIQAVVVVVDRLIIADQLAVVMEDRVLVGQALSLFVMKVHLHKQLAALYLR